MTIRRAIAADAEAVSALQREIQALHAWSLPHLFKPPEPGGFSPERVRSLLDTAGVRIWIAEIDAAVDAPAETPTGDRDAAGSTQRAPPVPAGYLYAELSRQGETALRAAHSSVYVNHICVTAGHRRRGIGRGLLAAAGAWAREEQADAVLLDVWGFNAAAQAFFAKEGFAPFTLRLAKAVR
jgi:GNAT superfamily N-acetyltransferase